MKIFLDLPWGGKLVIERQPMEKYKFYVMWACIAFCVVTLAFFGLLK